MTDTVEDGFVWTAHPARERPLAAVGAACVIVLFAGATYLFSERETWALFVTAVFCLALNRFYFVTRYSISDDEITARLPLLRTRTLRWDEVRRIEIGPNGAWVSPYRRRSWREQRRGVHVLFGRQRERILRELRSRAPGAMPDGAA